MNSKKKSEPHAGVRYSNANRSPPKINRSSLILFCNFTPLLKRVRIFNFSFGRDMSEHNDEHDTSVDDADAHPIVPPPAHLARARASPDDVRDALPGDRERAAFDELLA